MYLSASGRDDRPEPLRDPRRLERLQRRQDLDAAAVARADAARDHRLVDLEERPRALPGREIDADAERGLAHLALARGALRRVAGALIDVERGEVEVRAEGGRLVAGGLGAAENSSPVIAGSPCRPACGTAVRPRPGEVLRQRWHVRHPSYPWTRMSSKSVRGSPRQTICPRTSTWPWSAGTSLRMWPVWVTISAAFADPAPSRSSRRRIPAPTTAMLSRSTPDSGSSKSASAGSSASSCSSSERLTSPPESPTLRSRSSRASVPIERARAPRSDAPRAPAPLDDLPDERAHRDAPDGRAAAGRRGRCRGGRARRRAAR